MKRSAPQGKPPGRCFILRRFSGSAEVYRKLLHCWNGGDYEAELLFTVNMKNGGTIRVRQTHHFHAAPTYTYTPGDAPMNTTEQLQALLAEKATGVLESIDVNILFTRFPKKEVAHD